jgi:hypothetical protein
VATYSGSEDTQLVMNAVALFLGAAAPESEKKVYAILPKLLKVVGAKQPLFRNLLAKMNKCLSNKDYKIRLKSMSIFRGGEVVVYIKVSG